MRQRTAGVLVAVLLAVVLVFVFYTPLAFVDTGDYRTDSVTVHDANGTQLATVEVRIADTEDKRRVGLSRTDSLQNGSGMLFVHPDEGTHTYVMRNMSFPIDIVFVAENGTVTRIHHDVPPDDGVTSRYRGHGKYVLEVPGGWSNATGVAPGDTVAVPRNV